MSDVMSRYNSRSKQLNDHVISEQWKEITCFQFLNIGDFSQTRNYRGIRLSSQVAKIVTKYNLIENR